MLKRFLLFAGEQYYPCGGWEDFVGDFDTLEAAQAKAKAGNPDYCSWAHIVDLTEDDLWEYEEASDNKKYPDWPVMPAGWFNREQVRERQAERDRQRAAYYANAEVTRAAERKAREDADAAMRKRYIDRSRGS